MHDRACESATAGESHKLELAKKAIIMKGRDNTRIPFPVSMVKNIHLPSLISDGIVDR